MDEALTATVREAMPLAAHLGVEGVEASPERVVLRGAWAPEHCFVVDDPSGKAAETQEVEVA